MRQTLAVSLLFASVSSCVSGGVTPRAREVRSLRREVDALQVHAKALEAELAESRKAHAEQLEARADALRVELRAVRAEVTALLAELEESRAEQEETSGPYGAGEGARVADAAVAPAPVRFRAARVKPRAEEEAPAPVADPAGRVRALMADVAARLQVASESVGDDPQSAARLGRARQLLVEADRAAAKKQFEQAESLAQDAAEVVADTLTQAGTAQP